MKYYQIVDVDAGKIVGYTTVDIDAIRMSIDYDIKMMGLHDIKIHIVDMETIKPFHFIVEPEILVDLAMMENN